MTSSRMQEQPDDGEAGLFDPAQVDVVAVSPDASTIQLYIVVDRPWSGTDAQIRSLQEKIHSYVGFVVDGQLGRQYPDAATLPWQIVIDCQTGVPDDRTDEVIRRTADAVRRYGGELVVESVPLG